MIEFNDLPLDLLPLIIQHLLKPQHLTLSCLINKSFYKYSVVRLYEYAFVFAWHNEGKLRVTKLFWTLANCPHLAEHVQRLELRNFPKSLPPAEHDALLDTCLRGLANCTHLRVCTWTRDGSLTPHVLRALQRCPQLQELEINGHHAGSYDPRMLPAFSGLRRLALIMPSGAVIGVLPAWLQRTSATLRTLTLICKSSPLVTDALLESLAQNMPHIENIHLIGCPKVTHKGIQALLSANSMGVQSLGLEGLSQSFDMQEFGAQCRRRRTLARLRAITLTLPLHGATAEWLAAVGVLLWDAPLQMLQLYTAGGYSHGAAQDLDALFVRGLCARHGARLIRLAVLRLRVRMDVLEAICASCAKLEQLFVTIRRSDLALFGPAVAPARRLRAIHVSFAIRRDPQDELRPLPQREELLAVVTQCGPSLVQFGVQTRVWQVERVATVHGDGTVSTEVQLGPNENPDVPEVFLVVRT